MFYLHHQFNSLTVSLEDLRVFSTLDEALDAEFEYFRSDNDNSHTIIYENYYPDHLDHLLASQYGPSRPMASW